MAQKPKEELKQERRRDAALRRALAMRPKPHRSVAVRRLTVHADADELLKAIAAVEVSDALIQAIERSIGLAHLASELVEIQTDYDAAVGTRVFRVRFEPSKRLRDLVAAFSAGDL